MITLRNKFGFTVIELVIVIVIAAILAVFAFARWPGSGLSLDAEAKQMAGDIRYTQSLAMASGVKYKFVINTATKNYQIQDANGNIITLPSGGAANVTLNSNTSISTSNNLIVFYSDGRPYIDTAGGLLTSTATIVLQWSGVGFSKTISITPDTGMVSVS